MQLAVGHVLLLNKPFRAQESVPGEIACVTLPEEMRVGEHVHVPKFVGKFASASCS